MSMDCSHAFIPMGDGTYDVLYSQSESPRHVYDLRSAESIGADDFDRVSYEPPYDASELPFAGEESFEVLFLRNGERREALTQYQGKDVGEVKILRRNDLIKKEEMEPSTMNMDPPPEVYIEDILHPEYLEESLVLVWDKKRGRRVLTPRMMCFGLAPMW
jgi:hypothetical protein